MASKSRVNLSEQPQRDRRKEDTMLRRIMLLLVVLLIGAAYMLGYWPEHKQSLAVEMDNAQLKNQLSGAQALGRIARLQNELLLLIEQTESQNYGDAQKL